MHPLVVQLRALALPLLLLLALFACAPGDGSGSPNNPQPDPDPELSMLEGIQRADDALRAALLGPLRDLLGELQLGIAAEVSIHDLLLTTAADGRVLINALLADLEAFEDVDDLYDRDLLLLVSLAGSDSHAAVGRLAPANDGTPDRVMVWRGWDGASARTPITLEVIEGGPPMAAGKVKVRLTGKLKNPPEVNIEIEWTKEKAGESATGLARLVTPLPDLPAPIAPDIGALSDAWRAQLLAACCSTPPQPTRSSDIAAATRSDLTVVVVPYDIDAEAMYAGADVAMLLVDERSKVPGVRTCEGAAGSIGCRSAAQPFLNVRLTPPSGGQPWRALLTDPSNPSSVIAEGLVAIEEAAGGAADVTTIDIDHLPTGKAIIITITIRGVTIVITINL